MSMFGAEFEQVWPKAGAAALKFTDFGKQLLKKCQNVQKPDTSKVDIKKIIEKSANFPIEFGINNCRVISQPKERYAFIEKQIASAYPVIHERVLLLYLDFLEHKCKYGNNIEKAVFSDQSLTSFVQRLLIQRCVAFFGAGDNYKLISGEEGEGGFEAVGTAAEKPPLLLRNVMSYDEMKLSALLSVSSHTEFLNDGNRNNEGHIERNKEKIETEGVVIGIIGGRFERDGVMESQDILIKPEQNIKQNGYGYDYESEAEDWNRKSDYRRIWNKFYEEQDLLYKDMRTAAVDSKRFIKASDFVFDKLLMQKRYAISFDTLLIEANARAAAAKQQAYIHVVGIGLGVWKAVNEQTDIFLTTFLQRLKFLLPQLQHVSVVHFSWFHRRECGELKNNAMLGFETHPNGGIRIFLTDRNPADKLPDEYKDCLACISYAWDGNALPGNEFWMKMLSSTGDSSTACSTLISELHNPHINTEAVNGNNLHVATLNQGVMHIKDYCCVILK